MTPLEGSAAAPSESSSGSSSGYGSSSSSSGTDAQGYAPARVTVQFADGSQSTYSVEKHKRNYFTIGDPVSVIPDGQNMVIMAQ